MKKVLNLTIAAGVAGLLALPAVAMADNTASAYTTNGTAVVGAAAAMAGVADTNGFTKVLDTTLKNSGARRTWSSASPSRPAS